MKVKSPLRFALLLLALSTLAPLLGSGGASDPAPVAPSFAFTHVTVIDVERGAALPDRTVVVAGGRIAEIGLSASGRRSRATDAAGSAHPPHPTREMQEPQGRREIDASGKFLIPGLWDMHVHLAGGSAEPSWGRGALLPLLVAQGVTGVRDMGGDLEALLAWRNDVEAGRLVGPRIVASGPWLSGEGERTPEQLPVANAAEARAAVRDLQRRGADFVKIISLPSREAFFAVADEARKRRIPFAGHLPLSVNAGEAARAGLRSLEHLYYSGFSLSLSAREEELRRRWLEVNDTAESQSWLEVARAVDAGYSAEKAAALYATLKASGTWVTPTLASLAIGSHPEAWSAGDPGLAFVPPKLRREWLESKGAPQTRDHAARFASLTANDWKLTGELHRAGVELLAGSDSLDPFVFPGDSLHRELEELVRAGLTPAEALATATLGAARYLGREKELGTVEKGRAADLVLLAANPLADIANSRRIAAVVRGGRYLDRAALDALLDKARAAAAAAK